MFYLSTSSDSQKDGISCSKLDLWNCPGEGDEGRSCEQTPGDSPPEGSGQDQESGRETAVPALKTAFLIRIRIKNGRPDPHGKMRIRTVDEGIGK